MKTGFWLAGSLIGIGMISGPAQADEQTFTKPKAGPFRIDWCLNFGTDCGKPAADKFCQSKGFVHSFDFVEDVDIGATSPTIVQGTGQICNAPTCDGFTYVSCEKPPGPPPLPPPPPPPGNGDLGSGGDTQDFHNPRVGSLRMNICYANGFGCDGQKAADAFCDKHGYDDAADFQTKQMPPNKSSRYIGSGKLCKGFGCSVFQSITCENQP